ncbi:histidine phosphatase superfamily [Obelidium mucronatum]|nr:histidine phosphatase superfamily [Obelidium mucronatum]
MTEPSLTLKQLLIVHRHGERVPVRHVERIHQPGSHAFNLLWNQCSVPPFITALHEFRQSFEPALPQSAFGFLSRFAHAPHYPPIIGELKILQGDRDELPPYLFSRSSRLQLDTKTKDCNLCHPGQLTDKGKQTLLTLGNSIREKYTDSLHFLPSILTPHFTTHNLYVRSTGYIRTIESVQYLLGGLFPFQTRELGQQVTIHVKADENMYIDFKCKKLMDLVEPFKRAVHDRYKDAMEKLMTELTAKFPEEPKENKDGMVDMSTPGSFIKPSAQKQDKFSIQQIDAFYDTFKAMKAASLPLPKGVTDQDVESLGKIFMEYFLGGFVDASYSPQHGSEVKRLFTGRFVGDLLDVLKTRVEKPLNDPYGIKLALFSGHDTTIGPLLVGLGLFNGERREWPMFGANVTLELFEDVKAGKVAPAAADDRHFVRVRYNGVAQKLDFCQARGSHFVGDPTLCTYKAFNDAMKLIVPQDYCAECKL